MSKTWKTCSFAWTRPWCLSCTFATPLVDVFEDQTDVVEEFNNDLDALVQKKSSIDLNYE